MTGFQLFGEGKSVFFCCTNRTKSIWASNTPIQWTKTNCTTDCRKSPTLCNASTELCLLGLLDTNRLPCSGYINAGSATRSSPALILAEGIAGHMQRLLQPSSAACVRRRCPNRGVATGSCLPMRHRTDPDNFTKETETKENAIVLRKSLSRNGF